jgi:hypothetical protein
VSAFDPKQTLAPFPMALNAALHTSHRTMPNLVLTALEVLNIIAYILIIE